MMVRHRLVRLPPLLSLGGRIRRGFFVRSRPIGVAATLAAFGGAATAVQLGILLTPLHARGAKDDETIEMCEALYDAMEHQKIYDLLIQKVNGQPENADYLWRLARACYELGEYNTEREAKKNLIMDGMAYAKRATEVDPTNFAAQKWAGIMYSKVGDFQDTKTKISNAFMIKEHFVKAVELKPDDATSHHLLGNWCWEVANVNWITRKVASAVFASPPTATFEECLQHFERAERISPGFWKKNSLMLCKTQLKLQNKAEAKAWLEKCLAVAVKTNEDREVHAEAEKLRKSL